MEQEQVGMAETGVERWTATRLAGLPRRESVKYEIVDGELFIVHAADDDHQRAGREFTVELTLWDRRMGLGEVLPTPGLLLGEYDDVIPDVVWVSRDTMARLEGPERKLHGAPELVVEVLSPGRANERRDREVKLRLYGRIGVLEYWLADPRSRTVDVFRRCDDTLQHVATLRGEDLLTSPILPEFSVPVTRFFVR